MSIHVQNTQGSEEKELSELANFKFIDVDSHTVRKKLIVCRPLCLNCTRRPHVFRRPFNEVINATKPRKVSLIFTVQNIC